MSDTAVIVAGGEDLPSGAADDLPADAYVVAADSGLDVAQSLGLHVDIVIGDLDSVSPRAFERAVRQGAHIERHPVDKDATDLELALAHARERGVSAIIVIGGFGGRVDHSLANAALLASQEGINLEWRTGRSTIHRVNETLRLKGVPGALVSLQAFGGPARGIRTSGLRWPLQDEDLTPGSTRGISNRFIGDRADITLASGNLLVIIPD